MDYKVSKQNCPSKNISKETEQPNVQQLALLHINIMNA